MATTKRDGLPEFWPSHLTSILVGDQACLFRAWLPAHFNIRKAKGDFNFAAWKIDHTELLNRTVDRLEGQGWRCHVEEQNRFRLTGKTAVLVGKPDIVARKDGCTRVADCKTGVVKDANAAQVAIYMLVLPLLDPILTPADKIDGEVVYQDEVVPISAEQVGPIREKLFALLRTLGSDVRPKAVPSQGACKYCDIQACDCPDKWSAPVEPDVLVNEF